VSTDPHRPGEPATATCATCGADFLFDAAFYRSLGYRSPTRCRPCRAIRKARLLPARGVVVNAMPTAGSWVVRSDAADHAEFLVYGKPHYSVGDAVRWLYDPAPLPSGQRLRLAYSPEKA
jgi:hypothetical protein